MGRIAVGSIFHETHGFAPDRTTLEHFVRMSYYEGTELIGRLANSPTCIGGILESLKKQGHETVPLLYAAAMPSGPVTEETFQQLLGSLLVYLRNALPVNGVALALHGAMMTESRQDCEAEILRKIRETVGPDVPIVSTLDMHGNLSPEMVEHADILVAYDRNPHLDMEERGREAGELLGRLLTERLRPSRAYVHIPLLLTPYTTWTEIAPLKLVHERVSELERHPSILNISVLGGFAYADGPHTGASILVTADGDPELAFLMAQELASLMWHNRQSALYSGLSLMEALARVSDEPGGRGPIVLADMGDNIGGGTPGDGTHVLTQLIKLKIPSSLVILADPDAVAIADKAGPGAEVVLDIGGNSGRQQGPKVTIDGVVEQVTNGCYEIEGQDHFANFYGREVCMGRTALIRSGTIRLLLMERKTPPGDLAQLRSQGIIPEQEHLIAVKSAVAFRGAFEAIASAIYHVNTPGLCTCDLSLIEYRNLPRPVYPLDADMAWNARDWIQLLNGKR